MSAPQRAAVPVPPVVAEIAGDRPVTAVWVNELGGVTFAIGSQPRRASTSRSIPTRAAHLLVDEVPRLRWARGYPPCRRCSTRDRAGCTPRHCPDARRSNPRWADRPEAAARAIGAGLRTAARRAARRATARSARRPGCGADAPPADRLVVCHGDACAPNTLIADDGSCSGHVDLGDLGVADRWADLAIATMSLGWNYPTRGRRLRSRLLDAYGVTPDPSASPTTGVAGTTSLTRRG